MDDLEMFPQFAYYYFEKGNFCCIGYGLWQYGSFSILKTVYTVLRLWLIAFERGEEYGGWIDWVEGHSQPAELNLRNSCIEHWL